MSIGLAGPASNSLDLDGDRRSQGSRSDRSNRATTISHMLENTRNATLIAKALHTKRERQRVVELRTAAFKAELEAAEHMAEIADLKGKPGRG